MASYSNFYDAFVDFISQYSQWQTDLASIDWYREQMMEFAGDGLWLNAFSSCNSVINFIKQIHLLHLDMLQSNWRNNHFFSSIYWAWLEVPDAEPYELTMDDILSVMVTAEPEQVNYFVGLVDAYRQSIWNKPFNEEFFAALARGFEG